MNPGKKKRLYLRFMPRRQSGAIATHQDEVMTDKMDTPTNTSPSLYDRVRRHRLTTAFVLLATLSVGILAGSVLTRNVSGKEQAGVNSSDAKPLIIPSPVSLSNGFSQIVKQVGPAVVNINTEELPKPSTSKHKRGGQRAQPNNPDGDDDGQQSPGDMQD